MVAQTLTTSEDDRAVDPIASAGPALFLLLECDRPLASSSRYDLRSLDEVQFGRIDPSAPSRRSNREIRDRHRVLTIGVPDSRMSSRHARLVIELDRWVIEDNESKNGVFVNGTRHQRAILDDGDLLELGHTVFLFREEIPASPLPVDCDAADIRPRGPGLVTFLSQLARAFEDLAHIAPTPASVLLQGETGTGKELVARAVHNMASRTGPFVAVNCGALPATLVESELFGYRKGAFSGANEDREGLVRSADRGTLFLDEIGDLTLQSQAALLRVLQEREVTPLGASRPIPVDIKLVAATHHDLDELVAKDKFRRDLYARIAGFVLRLPPLRERREDLGILITALLSRSVSDPENVRLSCEAVRALVRHDWPLNIRELEGALGVAIALARGSIVKLEHLPEPVRVRPEKPAARAGTLTPDETMRRDELEALLKEHKGNISAIARAMGVSRIQVHRWFKRFALDPAAYR